MADSSTTRLAAAARTLEQFGVARPGYWREVAEVALAASDSVERPAVERLVAALRGLVELIDGPPITDATEAECDVALDAARDLLAEYQSQPITEASDGE